MIVHTSNRIEDLVALLADLVATPACEPSLGPLAPETIAVQGRGMERWLSMELSNRLGVWANPSFPFPRRLIECAFDAVLGPAAGRAGFEPESLTWVIADLLPRLLERREFAELQRFLAGDADGTRRIQLASRVAETLDHYVSYRPEMISAWEAGQARGEWQATLWREIVSRTNGQHLASRAQAFLASIGQADGPLPDFPARVSLFGITTLPPLWVEVLAALGRRVELHLFLLRCARDPLAEPSRANPLWTSLGSVGREFQQVLSLYGASVDSLQGAACDTGSLLEVLQRAVLEGNGGPGKVILREHDRSIQVHACHGPMREVEVLHDQLTALFEADPSLEPRDVIVMTPDVEAYAPFVEAVFDASLGEGERPRIAYRLADRRLRSTCDVVDAFWRVLDALAGRFTASTLVDLLLVDRIRNRFQIETADLDVLLEWIPDAGIRWGVDAHHRHEVGQPALDQNTWREGLDRMLLALAMPADETSLFAGTLPAKGVDLGDSDLLGRFAEFCEALFDLREKLIAPRCLDAWSQDLGQVLDRMIDQCDDGAQQQAWLRGALTDLAQRAREAGFDESVALASVRHQLDRHLEPAGESLGFLDGGVTICALVPMRSIPFRVVALLGMNDEAFPRSRQPFGFDHVAASPRPGDRTSRDDDRTLFLEALMSAREHLLITYVGRSVRDGSERAPSAVVDELLDEIARLAGVDARERLVVLHPLHSFSPRYFDGSEPALVSYSGSDREGAEALRAFKGSLGRPWVTRPLALDAADERLVELHDLARFFEHPVRAFLQRRLGLYLRDQVPELEDREPMELDTLERWKLGDSLLRRELSGMNAGQARDLLRAAGRLPPGALGDLEGRRAGRRVEQVAAGVRALTEGERLPAVPVDLRLGDFRLVGEIDDLWPDGRVAFQFSQLPHRRELGFWIRHLALAIAAPAIPVRSFFVAPSGGQGVAIRILGSVPDASDRLHDLLALYEQGHAAPLPLLPRTSRTQADVCMKFGWQREPVSAARRGWQQDGAVPAERTDPYLLQAFRDVDPLDPSCALPGGLDFAGLSRRVFEPYLLALQELG